MPRPRKRRKVCLDLKAACFTPQGILVSGLDEVVLEVDEAEAVRLADLKGLYQEDAAEAMGVSRATFGNIIKRARGKIARALIKGYALRINCPKFTKSYINIEKG